MRVAECLYSGSEPHGEEGIASLKELGIKTIVSVDGAKPAVEMARKYGMRSTHSNRLDGVPEEAGQSLARVMREAETPIYVHCHHGKHRGPAAVAVACVAAGDMTGKEALSILVAGTSKDYTGLWREWKRTPPPAEPIARARRSRRGRLVHRGHGTGRQGVRQFETMPRGKMDCSARSSGFSSRARGTTVARRPARSGRNTDEGYDEQFKTWLAAAEKQAIEFRAGLQARDANRATSIAVQVEQACKQCHATYRDQ